MVWVEPRSVTLLGNEITGVRAMTVSASAKRVVEEWTDGGPFPVFVDAADISVELVIERDAVSDPPGLLAGPFPGDQGNLRFTAAASGASAHAETIESTVVIISVKHTLHGESGPTQRIVCRAVSQDSAASPIGAFDPGDK